MPTIVYTNEYNYRLLNGGHYPALAIEVQFLSNSFDIVGIIDTGATLSLFSGEIANAIGIDINQGERMEFSAANDSPITAFGHVIDLKVDGIVFKEKVYFPEHNISRNLLGRSFIANLQIGFRENHKQFYITYTP